MPIRQNILRKGKAPRQNLQSFDVHIDESGVVGDLTVSKFFKISEFPSVLPAGNSSFLIEGSNLLKPDIELKIEILDRENNPIFHYAIPNYERELPSQRVAIEVYKDDIVDGIGSITILGELDPEENNIPEQFLDTYNVRFTAPININTTIKNTQPIRFFGAPVITVREKVIGVKKPVDPNSLIPITLTGSVEVNTRRHYYPKSPPGGATYTYFPETDTFSKYPEEVALVKYKQTKKDNDESQPQQVDTPDELYVPTPGYDISQTMVLKELEASAYSEPNKLSRDMSGASFTIRNVNLIAKDDLNNSISGSTQYELPTSFSDVLGIRNETTFFTLGNELTAENLSTNQIEAIGVFASSSNFELTFKPKSDNIPDQVYKKSYADITVGNLQTFSGDTYKAKIYVKEDGSSGGFEKIYETLVESPNQLVDLNSITGFKNIGSFTEQSIVQNYWVTSSVESSATIDNSLLMNSVVLSGSNYEYGQSFDFVTNQSVVLENNEPYLVEFVTAIKSAPKLQSNGEEKTEAKLEVFLTGSFQSSTQGEISLGIVDISENLFSSFDANNFNLIEKTQVADFLSHNESSKPSGSLGFRVHSGQFMLNDVRLRPFSETNFSPGFFKANVPMPKPVKRGQLYDFLVEFYDANNNKAKAVAIAEDILFDGAPQVMADGTDALLTGSMFLGNITGSGIEFHGGSAFIRTIGYNGFDDAISTSGGGFMIFSGSVSESMGTDEIYEGVGLELVDAEGSTNRFLKFRTNAQGTPSEFEIQTDTFYLGKDRTESNAQFVSGSNGNVEISSSNFHLTSDGDVVMQGTITAEAGNIGGFSIDPTSMFSGTQPTPTFFLSGSATGTNFDKTNLVISSSGFQVNAQGAMSASEGVIGGFSLGPTTISSSNLILDSSGEIRNQDYDPFLSGFKISSLGNGSAEFENIRVRGTLRTSVFEKETVNAVGGMLYVGNSTAISASVGSSDTAIFVDNVSGFENDEIIFAKKVTGTGFTKEFMKVTGSHRQNESSDTDFAGFLHVERAYGSAITDTKLSNATTLNGAIDSTQTRITVASTANLSGTPVIKIDDELMKVTGSDSTSPGTVIHAFRGIDGTTKASHNDSTNVKLLDKDASFIANLVSPAQTYTPGQVLVSTGRYIGGEGTNTTGSGYIMLNANPTIGDTPYIDFVERTGSGLYDMRLRTRLGDLSGLVGTRLGDEVTIGSQPGFGLAAENVFLSGLIKAQSGSIGGWEISDQQISSGVTSLNSNTEQLKFNKDSVAFGSGEGILIGKDGNDYEFFAGSGSNYIWWDGSNLNIKGAIRQTAGGTTLVDYADRGTWAAGVAYEELDLVQYDSSGTVSTYKCISDHTSTDDTSTSTGRPDTAGSTCWVVFASGGTTGATSKTVSIQASSYIAEYNSSGGGGSGTITLSANSQNFTDARFKFTGGGTDFTDQTTFIDGTDNNTSQNVTFTIPTNDTNAPFEFRVDVQEGTSGGSVASDTLTIAAIKPGADGSTSKVVSLTSPNYVINYNAAGSSPTPSGTLTLTATSQNFTNGFFKFTGDGFSQVVQSAESTFTDGTGANSDTFDITIPSSYFSTPLKFRVGVSEGDQSEVAFDTITISAVQPGNDGDDAYTVVLTNESHTLPTTDDGTITYDGSGTSIIAYKGTTELDGVTSAGSLTTGKFSASVVSETNITADDTFTSTGNPLVYGVASNMSTTSDSGSITYKVSLEGTSTEIEKVQSLSKAKQGDGALTIINTNQAHTLPASNAGVVSSFTNSGTTLKLFEGTRQLDYDDSGTTAGHFSASISQSVTSGNGITTFGSLTDSTNDLVVGDHSAMDSSTDSSLVIYTLTGQRFDGTAFTIDTTQTITKAKVGVTGSTGASINIVFKRASSTPATPSDSPGVPSGWADSPPAGTDLLFAVNGTKAVGATNFTWGTVYQVEGTAVAEVAIYRKVGSAPSTPTGGSYDFTTGALTAPTDWSTSVPTLSADGDKVYLAVGLFTGSPNEDTATTDWSTPVLYAQRTDGSDAQVITLSSDAMAFVEAKDGTITPSTITFTAKKQNISDSTTFSSSPSVTLGGSGEQRTLTSTNFGSNTSVKVTATAGSFEDDVTIVRLVEGSDAIASTNSNPAHIFPANSSGVVDSSDFTNSGTEIQVFEGTSALTYKTTSPGRGQYTISTTNPLSVMSTPSISGDNTTTATVADYSSMDSSTDSTVITYAISGKRDNEDETAFSFDVKQSFSKSKAGVDGTTARAVNLTTTKQVWVYDSSGENPAGDANATITATAVNSSGTAYYQFLLNDVNAQNSINNEYTYTPQSDNTDMPDIVEVRLREGSDSSAVLATDIITLSGVQPGVDGAAGLNSATVSLYNKNTDDSSPPSPFTGTITYTFSTGGVTTTGAFNGWTTAVPSLSAGEYAWVRQAAASSTTSTDTIAIGEWSTAAVHSGVGSDGASITGAAGNSNALVSLFRVSTDGTTAPASFSGTLTYTFSTGAVTGGTLNGWTTTIPTVPQGSYLWVRQAVASSNTSTDTIAIGEWSTAVVTAASGEDAYTVILTNESHTLPTTNDAASDGTSGVTYTGSGTSVVVYKGATELNSVTGTPGSGEFKVTATATNITAGAQDVSGNPAVFAQHSACNQNTAQISYAVLIENTTTITKIQSISKAIEGSDGAPGAPGATGAGIVFRGAWNNSDTYTKSDIRRDIVDYSAVNSSNPYWIAKNTNSNSAPPSSGTSANTNWETFGAQFDSVATDILFAQDVYADRTVNIGSSGGSNLISLNANTGSSGANPYITVGQGATQGFGNSGIFLGYESSTPKLSLVNSGGTRFFKWDGSDLDIKTSNLVVSSSSGTGASYKDLRIDSTVPQIRIQKDNSEGNENIIDIDGADGTIEVTVDGQLIFNSGEFEDMKTSINRIINSAPTTTGPTTENQPVTKVSNLNVGSNVDVKGTAFVSKGLLQQVIDNTTADSTVFLSEVNPTSYAPDVPGSSPVQQVFNVRKNIGTGTGAGKIVMQSTAFNSTIHAANGSAGVKFIDSGNTNLSSSLYQFQGILSQNDGGTSTGYFTNGNACLMSLDMDTQTMHSSVRQNFVYLQARRDIGETAGLKTVFQVQGPNGAIATAGNITAFAGSFNQVSDQRLKKDIYTISGSMNKVLQLRPTEFTWIEQDKQDVGFIAQEVEEIIPEVIETTDGFVDSETGEKSHENTKTISYTKLIPYLVDTIQQMDKRIKELEERDK